MSSKLCFSQAEMIRVFAEFGYTNRQLAGEYQVDIDVIRNIVKGRNFTSRPRQRGVLTGHARYRKLNAGQVRQIRAWAAEGHGEQKIENLIGGVVARGTIRQVISRKTYQDVT